MTQSNYYLYVMSDSLWLIGHNFFPLLFISVEKKQKTENKENKAL